MYIYIVNVLLHVTMHKQYQIIIICNKNIKNQIVLYLAHLIINSLQPNYFLFFSDECVLPIM